MPPLTQLDMRALGVTLYMPDFGPAVPLCSTDSCTAVLPLAQLDMWALGVTLYLLVFGELPFAGATPFHIYEVS